MKIFNTSVGFSTSGNSHVIDITGAVQRRLAETHLSSGFLNLFVPGATGCLSTMEYEPGLVEDLRQALQRIAPEKGEYFHNITHEDRNGHSHIRASLIGPSLTVPFENTALLLGKWQQIVFVDCDNGPRERNVVLQIVGEE
jgi:secondary thiamine-phosphate synthase enzyme